MKLRLAESNEVPTKSGNGKRGRGRGGEKTAEASFIKK